jgi:butyryl-CoA dehydrogenase
MNFELTKQQEFVRTLAQRFVENEVKPIAAEIDKNHRFPRETIEKMSKLGMLGIAFPKQYGGAGADYVSYIITIEEIAKACATTATAFACHNSLCCWPIYTFGNEEQKMKYLPDLLSGKKLGAFGLTEPSAGSDASSQQTKAVLDGEEWVLNGSKCFITNGGQAQVYVIIAQTDKEKGNRGISAFIVENTDPGFSIGKIEEKMGIRGSATAELVFQDCRIPKDRLLGKYNKGFKIAMDIIDGGRIGVAAEAVGIAEGALDTSIEYMKQRIQFGKPLTKFQGLQFEIAEMKTKTECARLICYKAAQEKNDGLPFIMDASIAKYYAAETAMYVTTKAVQLHGGYGYTEDYPVERMMRDAKITEIYEGTSEIQKMIISGLVLK